MTQYEKGFEDCKKQVKAAMVAAVENAILMEREACARLCDERFASAAGQAIRERGKPDPAFKNYMGDNWAGIV